ncbi:MAG: dihydrolipoamide acetyltransferase family protein [Candidatus Zixiibacteriota bacterium]
MAFEVVVPQMGESVLEGTIAEWKVAVGDKVSVNQPLVEIMTDKVNVEIPSEVEGTVEKLLVGPGDIVPVGTVICTIATSGEAPAKEAPKADSTKAASKPAAKAAAPAAAPVTKAASGGPAKMAPAVRKLVRDFGLDVSSIVATGPDGRITKEDVEKAAAAKSPVAGVKPPTPAPSQIAAPTPAPAVAAGPAMKPAKPMPNYAPPAIYAEREEERIPLGGARKAISDHMVKSKAISPHVTTFEDCDFTELVRFRNAHKDSFYQTYGAKLTYLPFIMKAAVEGLKEFPELNASMTDTEIVLKKYYNIGVAVARENGLIVPVLKDADKKSIIDIAVEVNDLGNRARADKLKLDEVQGGTFTLTNAGMFGATASTPIISQPQVAILGIHNIVEKPVVRNGEIVARHMMTFGLSFDHRLIDGHTAVQFLHRTIEYIENPARLLLRLR